MHQPGFWRSIGCETPKELRRHYTPDFLCQIYRGKRHETLGVEVEYTPCCFRAHKHDSFNVHLLVTLYAQECVRVYKNTPVISMYRRPESGEDYVWTLDDDINILYKGQRSRIFDRVSYGHYSD
jgi:hypothetical protein